MPHPVANSPANLRHSLRFVDEFGGGPASDFEDIDTSIAALRAIADELKAGLRDLERILAR